MIKQLIKTVYDKAENNKQEVIKAQAFIVCIAAAVCISLDEYFGKTEFTLQFIQGLGFQELAHKYHTFMADQLHALAYWVAVIVLFYAIVPIAIITFVFKDKLSNYGLSIKGALKDYKLYAAMIGIMLPLVFIASFTQSFQNKYPFYKLQAGELLYPRFLAWELLYLLQFFAVEFFFRGFMLHGNKNRFGFYSILVMTIPYCMIHFGKPLPETLAAIIAGLVLGILSLKSNSIWLGIAIHFSVAITMDFCSLWQRGLLF
ncbi:MAG: CPBP family intramembrane glutamic endopeptidase [Bacteroidota bacterium]